jgi:two-component system sensor histidine kinase/response regulator
LSNYAATMQQLRRIETAAIIEKAKMVSKIPKSNFFYTQILLIGIAYFLLALASIYFSRGAGTVAHFWYPNAIGILFLLQFDKKNYWSLATVLAIANFGANWMSGSSWWLSIAFVFPNTIEMLAATWLTTRFQIAHDFDQSPKRMLRFVFTVCLLPSGLGALIGASILGFFGFSQFFQVLPLWFVSSSVGTVSLLPLLLTLKRGHDQGTLQVTVKRSPFFYAFVVCAVSYISLHYLPFPFIYLVIPLIFAAVETDTKTVTFVVFLQSLVIGVMMHFGVFEQPLKAESGLSFLNYLPILVTFIPVLILAASMNLFRSQDKQKREIELELQRKHGEIQMIVDNVPALIGCWDTNLRNRFANRIYLDYFGRQPDEILGMHFRDVIGDTLYTQNLPFMEAALRGESQMFERTIIDPSGNARESLTSYVPSYRDGVIDGVYAIISDITGIKTAQRAELVAQAKLQSVIDSATEFSIITTDLNGIISLFSRGAEKMLGYSGVDLLGKKSPALLHLSEEIELRGKELSTEFNRSITGFEVLIAKAKQGINETREWTYVHKSGKKIPVRLVVTAVVDVHKNVTGYLGIANDISDEKELQRLLITAKENAEQMSQAKSDFVANMSHEIRTPMNAVLGMSQLLAATNLSSEQRKYLDMIKISGQSLMGILNDVLDFSKIEANRLELSNSEFLLDDVLGALASMMAVSVGDKDIEVAIGIDVDVPKRLLGDQLRLQQILTNLTGNALKFTRQGEVSVFVDIAPAGITSGAVVPNESNQVKLRFTVRDTGIGMDEAQLQRLFQPFSQADASTTRQYGGTGLGLSISKSILNLMGGEISVRSHIGRGSEFQVVVPLIALNSAMIEPSPVNQKRLNLLVVDDNLTSSNYICKTIRSWNWHVEAASSGHQALDIVRARLANGQHFDAIVVDWQMPMLDGLITIKMLREILPKGKTPLVIMVSAYSRDRMLQEQASEYADAILMKPITGSSIFDTVHEAIMLCSGVEMMPRYSKAVLTRTNQIQGAKLLLVEDNPFNQIVAKGFLEQGGATVEVMENGYLAVEHLRAHVDKYHLVLMDVQMPIMDGISATRMIRNELHLQIPIIAMTAGVMYSERDRCIQSGMNDFIAKPIDVEQMFSTIIKFLPSGLGLGLGLGANEPGLRKESAPVIAQDNLESEVFNPRSLEMLAAADPKSLQKILSSISGVVERASSQIIELRLALDEKKYDDAARLLHTMRGSVGTLGAKTFAVLSLRAETEIRDGGGSKVYPIMQIVEEELQKTILAARIWLDQKRASDTLQFAAAVPGEEEKELVQKLKAYLQQNNIAAADAFAAIKENLSRKIAPDRLAQLEQYINELDFERAKKVLAECFL